MKPMPFPIGGYKPPSGRASASDADVDDEPINPVKKAAPKKKSATTKKSGTFDGKSNKLGEGGRAAQLKAQGVPGAVIGAIARSKGAAPGGPNYKGGKK